MKIKRVIKNLKIKKKLKMIIVKIYLGISLELLWAVWGQIVPCSSLYFSKSIGPFPEKAMAPHSSTLAWKIPWTEEPGGLQSMESLRVGHN